MRACDNPFRTERLLTYRYQPLQGSWDELMDRLAALDYRCEIVGPEGSGKTTLLEDLVPRLEQLGLETELIRLNPEAPRFNREVLITLSRRNSPNHILLLDGSEQLSRLQWMKFKSAIRNARGVIITSHAAGRLPLLLNCKTSPELLARIACSLLETEPTPEIQFTAQRLFDEHRANLRAALLGWYDLFSGRELC